MPYKFKTFLIVLCIIFGVAQDSSASSDGISKTIFENGLTVLVQPMPSSEVISIYAYVKAGSATEGQYLGTGISHFVEHMLFKGTTRRGVGVISKEVQSLGGNINASTSLDYTIYTLDVPEGNFKQGLDIISDMLMNSSFDPKQVEKEREVIHGEMRLYYDRPDRRLSEDVFRNVYIRHPYRLSIIGHENLFDTITRDDLYDYYRSRYIPNNIIVSVAGAIKGDETIASIKDAFKEFKPLAYPEHAYTPEPPQVSGRYFESYYPTPLYRFSLAYQSVALTDPDLYALDVLAMALGQGESSRFYKEIYKKKGLVRSISCSSFTPQDRGIFEIEGVMDVDNLSQVRGAVKEILENVKAQGLSKEELAKTRRQVLVQFVFSNQTSSSKAHRAAADEAIAGDPEFSKRYVDAIKRVTNDDIKRVAKRYLMDTSLSVTVLKPESSRPKNEGVDTASSEAKIQKIVLDNGATLLLKEDHSVGVVSMSAVFHAGLRQENVPLNGISQLFAQVWARGTRSKSEEAIIKEMEERGFSVGGFAGKNSVGLQSGMLQDDLDRGIALFLDVLKNPLLSEEAITDERKKLYTAIDGRNDDIRSLTDWRLSETLFETHPYRLDPLGTKDSLAKISRKDVQDYYKRFIAPNNMVISVVGDFNSKDVIAKFTQGLAPLKKSQVSIKMSQEAPPKATRTSSLKTDKEQAVVMFAFQAPTMHGKDRFNMDVVDTLLGAGLSGRLFVKVRDELGKAYTVGSDYIPGLDVGIFKLFVLTTNDKIDTVKEIVTGQLRDLSDNPVSDDELKSAKSYLKGTFKMGLATLAAVGSMIAFNELYGLGSHYHEQFDANVDAVTKDDVRAVVRQYLDLNKAAIVITTGQ